MSQLKIDNLTLAYDGQAVVKGLTLEVEKGDYLCVVGENGSGKTTLMKSVLGLIKPIFGSISFSDGAKVGKIGYLPQHSATQKDFPASVEEVVMSAFAGKSWFPFYSKAMNKKAKDNLELLNISGLTQRPYRELSGGQQQRVLLARALCATESMLLLDEPVNGLDPNASEEMYSLITELNKKGMTIIMITHDIEKAVSVAGKILHLSQDKYFFGTTEEYLVSSVAEGLIKGGAK